MKVPIERGARLSFKFLYQNSHHEKDLSGIEKSKFMSGLCLFYKNSYLIH